MPMSLGKCVICSMGWTPLVFSCISCAMHSAWQQANYNCNYNYKPGPITRTVVPSLQKEILQTLMTSQTGDIIDSKNSDTGTSHFHPCILIVLTEKSPRQYIFTQYSRKWFLSLRQ